MSVLDLTGDVYGKLTVIGFGHKENGKRFWKCRCTCGNECEVNGKYLRNGDTKSCGKCYRYENPIGKRFGNLVVISRAKNRGRRVYWKCRCDCGNEVEKRICDLTSGRMTSCGHCKVYMSNTMVGRKFGELEIISESDNVCTCRCSCGNEVKRSSSYLLSDKCTDCGHSSKGFHDENLTGQTFGNLTVIGYNKNLAKWECKCSCGSDTIVYVTKSHLKVGDIKSCGCLLHIDKYENIAGQKFNHLTAIKFAGRDKFGKILWKCVCDCRNHTEIVIPVERLKNGSTKSCGCVSIAHTGSANEIEIRNYLRDELGVFTEKARILDGKEIDIYSSKLNLGIEYNGSMYHATINSVYDNKPKNYHQQKFLLAKEKGIHLINIFDVEYKQNKDKILAYLKDIINPKFRLYARKCQPLLVDKEIAWDFYNKYHLQGKSYMSQINYGLYYNNELVACTGFGKLRMKNASKEDCYELHRYCVKHQYSVIGGIERLFTAFIKDYSPQYIKSYSDNNYFLGGMYGKLGFIYTGQSSIPYFWVLKDKKLKREQCQVKKLKVVCPDLYQQALEESASNKEDYIMSSLGAYKVYTAGNSVWEWKLS